jgi:hypothetical protein
MLTHRQDILQLTGAMSRVSGDRYAPEFDLRQLKRREHVLRFSGDQDLSAGFEEAVNSFPVIADEGGFASCCFE